MKNNDLSPECPEMEWLDTGADLMDDVSEADEMEYGSQSKRKAEFEIKKGKDTI